jgi:hypothetical protein
MKLLVIQNHDHGYSEIAELCCPTVSAYASRHGYSYCCYRGSYSGLPSAWDKLFLAEALLGAHDYVWTLDTDVLILAPELAIGDMIDPAFDVNICGDGAGDNPWNVNTGSVVWKSTRWTKSLLWQVASEGFTSSSRDWEQGHIQSRLRSSEVARHFKRHHFTLFNHHGRFLRHFCGTQDLVRKLADIRDCLARK